MTIKEFLNDRNAIGNIDIYPINNKDNDTIILNYENPKNNENINVWSANVTITYYKVNFKNRYKKNKKKYAIKI